ncbi:MAG: hypothetical protein HY777_01180 [Betaproteobacteria bacterium]|nr:hypothetical protein [Betaproteobacteria bacterium]
MPDSRLKVAFLSLPQRTHAVLEYFIASTGQGDFVLSPDEQQSDAAVFDFDNPDSRHRWERYHAQLGRPGILLSIVGQQVPMTVWVQKPVTTGSMLEAAARIKAGAWCIASPEPAVAETVAAPKPEVKTAPTPGPAPTPTPEPTPEPALAPKREPVLAAPVLARPGAVSVDASSAPVSEAVKPVAATGGEIALPPVLPPAEARVSDVQPPKCGWLSRLLETIFRAMKPRVTESQPESLPESLAGSQPLLPAESPALSQAVSAPAPDGGGVAADGADFCPDAMAADASGRQANVADDNAAPAPSAPYPVPEASAMPEAPAPEDEAGSDANIEAPPGPAPKLKAAPSPAEMADVARYCGVSDDIPAAEFPRAADRYYPYDRHLVSALREAYMVGAKWRSPTRLDLDLGCLIFVPAENCAYLDFPEEALFDRRVVSQPRRREVRGAGVQELFADLRQRLADRRVVKQPRRHKVRMVGVQEFADLQQRLASLTRLDRFDATLWKLGMTTAKGRLPAGTDVNKVFFLKSWPNMTRFQRSPYSLRIAALWATRGASLLETARILEIPQRYVFAFYNAALATDIVTDDGAAVKRSFHRTSRNQGRFMNLFKWLRG